MRPNFVTFKLIEGPGKTRDLPININLVITVVPITVAGVMAGPDGEPMGMPAAGLDVGFRIIPVDCSVKEALRMLEGKEKEKIAGPGELE